MEVSTAGLALIEQFEGFESCPYWDSYGNVWTRGYGETEGITQNSKCISQAEASENLKRLLAEKYEYAIRDCGVEFNQNQWDSLCSTIWNLGPGIIASGSQLGDLLRGKDFTGYANALMSYDHAGGVELAGLRTRREDERNLFLKPVPKPNPLDVLTKGERKKAEEYLKAKKHPRIFRRRLERLRNEIEKDRDYLYIEAKDGKLPNGKHTDKGWNVYNRKARDEELWNVIK